MRIAIKTDENYDWNIPDLYFNGYTIHNKIFRLSVIQHEGKDDICEVKVGRNVTASNGLFKTPVGNYGNWTT